MSNRFRRTLAQLNPTVGDLAGNADKARTAWEAAKSAGSDMVALPEMFITGYNAQDLVMRRAFQLDVAEVVAELAAAMVGNPSPVDVFMPSRPLGQLSRQSGTPSPSLAASPSGSADNAPPTPVPPMRTYTVWPCANATVTEAEVPEPLSEAIRVPPHTSSTSMDSVPTATTAPNETSCPHASLV